MKVFVLGSTGMAGQALVAQAKARGWEVIGAARKGADLEVDVLDDGTLSKALDRVRPDILLNTVAKVNLAECEKDPGMAYRVNTRPAGLLAEYARKHDLYLVQISTDHYYSGDVDSLHAEAYPVCLLNEYARTKFLAEKLAETWERSLVVRTNIVGYRGEAQRPTFVEWAVGTMQKRQPLNLFSDFYTSSLAVSQFSSALFDLVEKRVTGTVNLASREVSSKEGFIRRLASRFGYDISHATVGSVSGLAGSRHADSLGLDVSKAESLLGYRLPTLDEVVDRLYGERREQGSEREVSV